MSLRTSDFDYPLPEDLIAKYPLPSRDQSRMMVLHRNQRRIEHRVFSDFPSFVRAGDLVALNNTRVMKARVFSDDGRIELLFAGPTGARSWKCLVKPGKKMRNGAEVVVQGVVGRVVDIAPDGERIIEFEREVDPERGGILPLPPYFERQAEASDTERYQTVYAEEKGAVAAPTAGLHFTPEILAAVPHAFLTLHVGIGTFRPVQAEEVTEHRMHSERYRLTDETARAINSAARVICVGTTTTRVLEACALEGLPLQASEGSTDIFIYPPFEFKVTGALLTNFHLPRSTLLMLISAFAGREFVLEAYEAAVKERYRFYSYGDCMLIL